MKILIANQQKRIKIDRRKIRIQATRLLKLMNCATKEISITFVDDPAIQLINKQYLRRNRPTNVISFSLQEGAFGGINSDVLGDIVISVDTASKDAERGDFSLDEEILFLMIHGFLHLIGYNHENTTRTNAIKMKQKEKELFRLLTQYD